MTTLLYSNIRQISDDEIGQYLENLPGFMKAQVMRYKHKSDQKSRLLARLMLLYSMEETGVDFLLKNWKVNTYNKPSIDGWYHFNISHSGELVVLSYSNDPIGVDIEQQIQIDFKELIGCFHPEERSILEQSGNDKKCFYTFWSRKESLLKAVGTGITDELDQINCAHSCVHYQGTSWNFHPVTIHPEYSLHLCSSIRHETPVIKSFSPLNRAVHV